MRRTAPLSLMIATALVTGCVSANPASGPAPTAAAPVSAAKATAKISTADETRLWAQFGDYLADAAQINANVQAKRPPLAPLGEAKKKSFKVLDEDDESPSNDDAVNEDEEAEENHPDDEAPEEWFDDAGAEADEAEEDYVEDEAFLDEVDDEEDAGYYETVSEDEDGGESGEYDYDGDGVGDHTYDESAAVETENGDGTSEYTQHVEETEGGDTHVFDMKVGQDASGQVKSAQVEWTAPHAGKVSLAITGGETVLNPVPGITIKLRQGQQANGKAMDATGTMILDRTKLGQDAKGYSTLSHVDLWARAWSDCIKHQGAEPGDFWGKIGWWFRMTTCRSGAYFTMWRSHQNPKPGNPGNPTPYRTLAEGAGDQLYGDQPTIEGELVIRRSGTGKSEHTRMVAKFKGFALQVDIPANGNAKVTSSPR